MSVDREYRIRISTVTEASAAGQTADDLKKVGKAGEEAGEGVKFFEFHGREMHKLVGELDRIIPGVGLALKVAFNPAALGIGATVLIIEQAKRALEEYNKKLDEIGEAAAKADFASGIQAALDVARDATAEQEKYLHNLHEIEKGEHGVAVQLNNQLQLIAAIEAAKQAQAEADKTLALAKLKEDQVTGRISESDAIIEKGEIEKKYMREKRAAEDRKFQEEQSVREKAVGDADGKQADLNRRQAIAEAALEKARAEKARATKDRDELATPENLKKASDAAEEAARKVELAKRRLAETYVENRPEFQAKLDQALADQAAADSYARNLNAIKQRGIKADGTKLTPLELAAADAKKAAEDNAKAEAEARAKARQAQAEHDAAAGPNAGAERSSEGAIESGTRAELMARAKNLQKEFKNQGAAMTQQDAMELLDVIRQMGEAFAQSQDRTMSKEQVKAEIQALRRLIESKGK
jgi:hypothetical protein